MAQVTRQRLEQLAQITEESGRITRTFGSPAMRRANELVGSWLQAAGASIRTDALGNLIGRYPAAAPDGKTFLLGSHLDTVRDAGKFDGPLGVLVALACLERLHAQNRRLPFAIEIIGFADEEGVRFQSTYLGSRVLAGTLPASDLDRVDANGISLREAIRAFGGNPDSLAAAKFELGRAMGYVEVHIEQGPVLEQKQLAVGVVAAISGQTRVQITFRGAAGHAGTVPMSNRRDALCAAAEFVLVVEDLAQNRGGMVATVGEIAVQPGATNVIPGEAKLSLDIRHPDDSIRNRATMELRERAEAIAAERGLNCAWGITHDSAAVRCDRALTSVMENAVRRHQREVPLFASGAGHDAAALAAVIPVSMLFVRCRGGVSHHPDEFASEADIGVAIEVLSEFLDLIAKR